MKKKRFIKLIMGRVGASRNEARVEAEIVQGYQAIMENCNHDAKCVKSPKRLTGFGYERRWGHYLEAMAYLEAEKAKGERNEG